MTAELDWDLVDQMLLSGCHGTEVADYFGIHRNTLYRKIEEEKKIAYGEYLQQKRGKGNALLKTQQFAKALGKSTDGDTTMLIWLGKSRLKQRECKEEEVENFYTATEKLASREFIQE